MPDTEPLSTSTLASKGSSAAARPIVVTGIPRAGTSWVGKMLEASGRVVYVNEPLNTDHPPGGSPGVFSMRMRHRFTYITDDNAPGYIPAFERMFALRYNVVQELRRRPSFYELLRMVKYWTNFTRGRARGRRPLLDDPFAVLSAAWLARQFDAQVIVMVRHPAAVLASRKRLRSRFDFDDLLQQPLLMRDWLEPFRPEMEGLAGCRGDAIEEGSLLWKVLYHVVSTASSRNPGIQLVRHEDLSLQPLEEFRQLYAAVGLPFSERVRAELRRSTSGGVDDRPHAWSVARRGLSRTAFRPMDSKANVSKWRSQLDAAELATIRAITEDVAGRFYGDADW